MKKQAGSILFSDVEPAFLYARSVFLLILNKNGRIVISEKILFLSFVIKFHDPFWSL